MQIKRSIRGLLALVALTVILAGCGGGTPNNGQKEKLRVGFTMMNHNPSTLWVAKDKGMFDKYGLDVELMFIEGGTKGIQALVSKDVPIIVVAGSAVVNAKAEGADVKMIAGLVNTMTYDLVVPKEVQSAADLKGKKLGVSKFGSSSDTAIRFAVRKLGLDPQKDVNILQVGTETARIAALKSGQMHATVLDPSLTQELTPAGFHPLLALYKSGLEYQHTGVATSEAYIKSNRATVDKFAQALLDSIAYYKDPKNEAEVLKIIDKYLQLEGDSSQNAKRDGYIFHRDSLLNKVPYATIPGMQLIAEENKKTLDPKTAVDNSILEAFDKSGFIAKLYK